MPNRLYALRFTHALNDFVGKSQKRLGSFMESLIQTLSDPAGAQRLAGKLTETNEKGKTYLKIPVSNSQVIENALKLFSGLLAGLGKNS